MLYSRATRTAVLPSVRASDQKSVVANTAVDMATDARSALLKSLSVAPGYERRVATPACAENSAPMCWTGANSQGNAVIGVAVSAAVVGTVEVIVCRSRAPDTNHLAVSRRLTPHQARQLARYLAEAANEAQRCETLQQVAFAARPHLDD
jgi:hypothetical protein